MEFKVNKPIRLIELFAGIGSQAMALRDLGADFEHYRVVEFDKHAIASYNAIRGTVFPAIDITTVTGADLGIVDTDKYIYILTYSFPCQDLSVAGYRRGMAKGNNTRSGLLWEVERLLNETTELPQVLVMENVPQVHGNKNRADFEKWMEYLDAKGYKTYWQDLNAADYGIPQSRKRCIAISILGDYHYTFPSPQPLESVMADYLESKVDDRYYFASDKAKDLVDQLVADKKLDIGTAVVKNCGSADPGRVPSLKPTDVAITLCACDGKGIHDYGNNAVLEKERMDTGVEKEEEQGRHG